MGGKVVGDMLLTLADPNVLIAADLRDHLAATEKGRGAIDKRRRAIERIRYDSENPDLGMLGLEGLKQAQGELFFGGILRVRGRFARPLFWGDSLFLEGLGRFIPRTQLRGGLIKDNADGHGDFRGHQDEKNQALPPEIAATFFIAQFIQIGKRLGRFRTRVVGVVDDEAARGKAVVPQDDPHTGHQELVPGNLAMAKHPGQGRHRIRAEAGAFKTRPAHGVGHQHGGDTKGQPGPLRDGHRMMGVMRADGGVNGVNKGTYKGGWLANHHRCLQAIGHVHNQRT